MNGTVYIFFGLLVLCCLIISFMITVYQHETGHMKAHKEIGDTKMVKSLLSVKSDINEAISHTPEQEINILEAGYKRNLSQLKKSIFPSVLCFAAGVFMFKTNIHVISIIGMAGMGVSVSYPAFNFIGYIGNNMLTKVYLDGAKVKAIKAKINDYEIVKNQYDKQQTPELKNLLLQQKIKLEITKLQGEYEKIQGMSVDIVKNMAYITSPERNGIRETILVFNEKEATDTNRGFSVYNKNSSGEDKGFDDMKFTFNFYKYENKLKSLYK